jgi:hypothetical protein
MIAKDRPSAICCCVSVVSAVDPHVAVLGRQPDGRADAGGAEHQPADHHGRPEHAALVFPELSLQQGGEGVHA